VNNPFGPHVDVVVERYGTHQRYHMQSMDAAYEASTDDVAAVLRICDEPLTWRSLFRDRLGGRRYEERDALEFIEWARHSWESGEHMVFLLRDPDGRIGACLDVKDQDESGSAYVGYWAGAHHRGVVTNAVLRLAGLAKEGGCLKFVALVDPENIRSAAVLKRA
jgi:RimJ/RimL family protein N-acetyltransferase